MDIGSVVGVKIPLSDDPVVSTSRVDYLAGLIFHKGFDQHHVFTNIDLTFNGDYALRSDTTNHTTRFFGMFAYNYETNGGNTFIIEFKYSTAPFEDPSIEYLYEISSATNMGYVWNLKDGTSWELFVLEDNEPYKNYSDISFGVNYSHPY